MPTASLEAMLEIWSTSLREARDRIRPLFDAPSVARSASALLDGLLGAERRKTGWMRAEAAGVPEPSRQQAVLGRNQLDADALRDVVREHMVETWDWWDWDCPGSVVLACFARKLGCLEDRVQLIWSPARADRPREWRRLSGRPTLFVPARKGARLSPSTQSEQEPPIRAIPFYNWAYCELADLEVGKKTDSRSEVWTGGLLVRRSISDGQRAYFTTCSSAGTMLQTLVQVE